MRAKRYMSDEAYTYIGTITSWKLYRSVVKGLPKPAAETERDGKVTHNRDVLRQLQKVQEGLYRDQFVGRLDDAMALCEHKWHHFRESPAEIPVKHRLTPPELILQMIRDKKRSRAAQAASASTAAAAAETTETAESTATPVSAATTWGHASCAVAPPPMRQRTHMLAQVAGVSCGRGVQVAAPFGGHQPATIDEFERRPVAVGSFVVTRARPQERVERACKNLNRMQFWIWKVLHTYKAGDKLPPNVSCIESRDAVSHEAHLYRPSSGTSWTCKVEPVWDMMAETIFLSSGVPSDRQGPEIHVPFTALLRPEDVLGGGFLLTSAQHVPNIVRTFMTERCPRSPRC